MAWRCVSDRLQREASAPYRSFEKTRERAMLGARAGLEGAGGGKAIKNVV